MELVFAVEGRPGDNIIEDMRRAAECILEREGIVSGETEISISFVAEDEIKELNRVHRGIDKVTDVLSFPQYEYTDDVPVSGPVILGDVVICTERAKMQAAEYGHSEQRELVYLFVHSVLHLLGYDHMGDDEKAVMRAVEEEIMGVLNIAR